MKFEIYNSPISSISTVVDIIDRTSVEIVKKGLPKLLDRLGEVK